MFTWLNHFELQAYYVHARLPTACSIWRQRTTSQYLLLCSRCTSVSVSEQCFLGIWWHDWCFCIFLDSLSIISSLARPLISNNLHPIYQHLLRFKQTTPNNNTAKVLSLIPLTHSSPFCVYYSQSFNRTGVCSSPGCRPRRKQALMVYWWPWLTSESFTVC